MPTGFALALVSLVVDRAKWSPAAVLAHVTAMPSLLFLIAGLAGMFLMGWFARHLDGRDAKANWREQAVNGISSCLRLCSEGQMGQLKRGYLMAEKSSDNCQRQAQPHS